MSDGRRQFGEALAARRAGVPSQLGADASFPDVKPDFYADAYGLVDEAVDKWRELQVSHAPYGLVGRHGLPVERVRQPRQSARDRWVGLERALAGTVALVFDEVSPKLEACPYAPVLRDRVGTLGRLAPYDHDERGIDTLRARTYPGGVLAPALIVGLMRRMHAMKRVHAAKSTHYALAEASSRSLLDTPLRHPQQWAKAFMYTIGEGYGGDDWMLNRDTFLNDDRIKRYTRLHVDVSGVESIAWLGNHEDYTLTTPVTVADRTRGHEGEPGDHQRLYPIGTRLGDIEVTEPTIKCPGFKLAYAMWGTALDVASKENLWTDELTV